MSAKVKLPDPLDKLLRSQLEKVIEEAAFHTDDELIARRRIIDKWNQIDVYIFRRVKDVAKQLYKNKGAGD